MHSYLQGAKKIVLICYFSFNIQEVLGYAGDIGSVKASTVMVRSSLDICTQEFLRLKTYHIVAEAKIV